MIVGVWIAIGVGNDLLLVHQARSLVGQSIPPVSFEGAPASVAIERIVTLARDPIGVGICRDLAAKPVTLKTSEPKRLEELLVEIGRQIGAHVQMYDSLHQKYAAPTLSCQRLHRGHLTDPHEIRITAARVTK